MNKSQLIEELSKRVGNDKAEIRYIGIFSKSYKISQLIHTKSIAN